MKRENQMKKFYAILKGKKNHIFKEDYKIISTELIKFFARGIFRFTYKNDKLYKIEKIKAI